MQFKTKAIILGAKLFNDEVEGTRYDTTKIIVVMPQKEVKSDRNSAIGSDAQAIQFGTSVEYGKHKLHDAPYPHEAELDLEMTNKGVTCTGYKFLGAAKLLNAA